MHRIEMRRSRMSVRWRRRRRGGVSLARSEEQLVWKASNYHWVTAFCVSLRQLPVSLVFLDIKYNRPKCCDHRSLPHGASSATGLAHLGGSSLYQKHFVRFSHFKTFVVHFRVFFLLSPPPFFFFFYLSPPFSTAPIRRLVSDGFMSMNIIIYHSWCFIPSCSRERYEWNPPFPCMCLSSCIGGCWAELASAADK